jgi:DNA-binding PadR family transcriptional regulator
MRSPLLTETNDANLGYRGHNMSKPSDLVQGTLDKLEQEGWITAEWKTSEYGRRAKYYSLTRLGRRQLEKEADNWGRLSSAISRVIELKEA